MENCKKLYTLFIETKNSFETCIQKSFSMTEGGDDLDLNDVFDEYKLLQKNLGFLSVDIDPHAIEFRRYLAEKYKAMSVQKIEGTDFFHVRNSSGAMLVNRNGQELLAQLYKEVKVINNTIFVRTIDTQLRAYFWYQVDSNGKHSGKGYSDIKKDGSFIITYDKNRQKNILKDDGTELFDKSTTALKRLFNGHAVLYRDDNKDYFIHDTQGELILQDSFDTSQVREIHSDYYEENHCFPIPYIDGYNFYDFDKKKVLREDHIYKEIPNFSGRDYAIVETQDGVFDIIDREGNSHLIEKGITNFTKDKIEYIKNVSLEHGIFTYRFKNKNRLYSLSEKKDIDLQGGEISDIIQPDGSVFIRFVQSVSPTGVEKFRADYIKKDGTLKLPLTSYENIGLFGEVEGHDQKCAYARIDGKRTVINEDGTFFLEGHYLDLKYVSNENVPFEDGFELFGEYINKEYPSGDKLYGPDGQLYINGEDYNSAMPPQIEKSQYDRFINVKYKDDDEEDEFFEPIPKIHIFEKESKSFLHTNPLSGYDSAQAQSNGYTIVGKKELRTVRANIVGLDEKECLPIDYDAISYDENTRLWTVTLAGKYQFLDENFKPLGFEFDEIISEVKCKYNIGAVRIEGKCYLFHREFGLLEETESTKIEKTFTDDDIVVTVWREDWIDFYDERSGQKIFDSIKR